MIKEAIRVLSKKVDLDSAEMEAVFSEIMNGEAGSDDVKEFLLSLKAKGESPGEIAAAAKIMRDKMTKVSVPKKDLIDTCGTGGAPFNDINVSTVSAIILAGCGMKVAKHGNVSFTGKCGSADILMELGVNINIPPEKVAELIEKIGIGFIFAKNFHPAMKNVAQIRSELKTRTIFNILGPLSNPAGAKMQVLGVFKAELTEVMAEALNKLGSERAFVVHGYEGLDEISIKGKTRLSELKDGKVETHTIEPSDFGIKEGSLEDIRGGSREHNKKAVLEILEGKDKGPRLDMVLINSGAALHMAGKAGDFREGVKIAAECVSSGKALETLRKLIDESGR
ncbi:MAG: anthranilate phosphoribosyltransferase [Candidatus Omnitrophica bacterium]|nr:anthranilate phosphoribosyltransferase [Candidatus Omnitrophota bacterium]